MSSADKILAFGHYEYIVVPLFVFLLVMFSLQQAGFITSSEDTTFLKNRPLKTKFVDLGSIVIMIVGCVIFTLKKNPELLLAKYTTYFITGLFIISFVYGSLFKKEINIITKQHNDVQRLEAAIHKNRKRNMILYLVFVTSIVVGFVIFGDGLFSDSISTVVLVFGAIILYVVGFIVVWNK